VRSVITDFNNTPTDGETHTVVGKLDFANDLLSIWVDPILNDTEANNTPLLNVTVNNLPAGDFHIRKSTDGQSFDPFVPGVDVNGATPMPLEIPVDTGMSPTLLLQVFEGLSSP
jgi:hypothetical protein